MGASSAAPLQELTAIVAEAGLGSMGHGFSSHPQLKNIYHPPMHAVTHP
jgi:hypothetical protein